jgi:plastocyanin
MQVRSGAKPFVFEARTGFLLALIAATVWGCGDDQVVTTPPPNLPGGNAVTVTIPPNASDKGADAFGTNPLIVQMGTTVTWINGDTTDHTVTSTEGAWDSGTLTPGASYSRTFSDEGEFPYQCEIHPDMMGTVEVQASPSPSPSPSGSPSASPSPTASPSASPTTSPGSSPSPIPSASPTGSITLPY